MHHFGKSQPGARDRFGLSTGLWMAICKTIVAAVGLVVSGSNLCADVVWINLNGGKWVSSTIVPGNYVSVTRGPVGSDDLHAAKCGAGIDLLSWNGSWRASQIYSENNYLDISTLPNDTGFIWGVNSSGGVDYVNYGRDGWLASHLVPGDYVSLAVDTSSPTSFFAARSGGGIDQIFSRESGWEAASLGLNTHYVDLAPAAGSAGNLWGVRADGGIDFISASGSWQARPVASGNYISVCARSGGESACASRADGGIDCIDANGEVSTLLGGSTIFTDLCTDAAHEGHIYATTAMSDNAAPPKLGGLTASDIKAKLESDPIAALYSRTYYSLVDRVAVDGYLLESTTGLYPAMFCRTVGAFVSLLLETETGEFDTCEKVINFTLEGMARHKLPRIPHVLGSVTRLPDGKETQLLGAEDQIDGQAHVIMAWARLALKRGATPFEDRTYPVMSELMDRTLDFPYFFYLQSQPDWATNIRLIQNVNFEHSREGRFWHCFDLLSQSFVGAAADAMIAVAKRRGDTEHVERWTRLLAVLRTGIQQNLTRDVDGKQVYLEMRLPDGAGGVPFTAMGWVNLSPVAAQWEALDHQTLVNTVEVLRNKLRRPDPLNPGLHYLTIEFNPDGSCAKSVVGKGVGWDIDYARKENDWTHIGDWLDFLTANHSKPVFMEQMNLVDGKWVLGDEGNGEQCSWWCWAIARLRKEVGLPATPPRVK